MARSFRRAPSLAGMWFPAVLIVLLLLALPGVVFLALHLFGKESALNGWLKDHFGVTYHLATPWWTAVALLLVPLLLILLYFLKLKRTPLQVPSTFLWRKSIEDLQVNSLFQWLRDNMLLLVQLLIVLLLIYSVLSLQVHGNISAGKHYILLIDSSASMAVADVGKSRLEAAKDEALREIDAHNEGDMGMVLAFNSRASILQPYTSDRALMRAAVAKITQTQRPTRIDEALQLADSLANPLRSTDDAAVRPANEDPAQARTYVAAEGIAAEVHLFSDGRFPDVSSFAAGNLDLNYHRIGKAGAENVDNIGLGNLNAARDEQDPSKLQVFARLLNFRSEPATVKVEIEWRVPGRDDFNLLDKTVTMAGRKLGGSDRRDAGPTARLDRRDAGPTTKQDRRDAGPNTNQDRRDAGPNTKQDRRDAGPNTNQDRRDAGPNTTQDRRDAGPNTEEANSDEPGEGSVLFSLGGVDDSVNVVIHARLREAHDAFPLDDEAWLVVGVVRKARVLIVTPGNEILHKFFDQEATAKVADVTYRTPADLNDDAKYRGPARNGEYDLVLFDRCAPEKEEDMPLGNTFFIARVPPPWRRADMPPLNEMQIRNPTSNHPLMRNLSALDEIAFRDAFRFDLRAPGVPPRTPRLLETDRETAVLFVLPRRAFQDVVLAFPLIDDRGEWGTTWNRKLSFPVFLRNVLYTLGNVADAAAEENVQPGQIKTLRPDAAVKALDVIAPSRRRETITRGTAGDFSYKNTDTVGVYEAAWAGGQRRFAVNLLDADESNIQPRDAVKIGEQRLAAGQSRRQTYDIWKWIAVAALVLLVLEWAVYHRRVFF
ncbi:MAG TPA: VWA domain-containing protein [Gemmataceae bacterium]|nr:VWA domain-containing protein [Gemmataceae bacterium]